VVVSKRIDIKRSIMKHGKGKKKEDKVNIRRRRRRRKAKKGGAVVDEIEKAGA